MERKNKDIFQRLLNGEAVSFNDPDYHLIHSACYETRKLLVHLNSKVSSDEINNLLSKITASDIDSSIAVFPPFQINYGKNTKFGKNVFVNFDCTFLDLGGITIDDNVMIAPKVSLLTEGHPLS